MSQEQYTDAMLVTVLGVGTLHVSMIKGATKHPTRPTFKASA